MSIIFKCSECFVPIIKDSRKHDECITTDGVNWVCGDCDVKKKAVFPVTINLKRKITKICENCEKPADKRCAGKGCKVCYCSIECQKACWKEHKPSCGLKPKIEVRTTGDIFVYDKNKKYIVTNDMKDVENYIGFRIPMFMKSENMTLDKAVQFLVAMVSFENEWRANGADDVRTQPICNGLFCFTALKNGEVLKQIHLFIV